MSDIGGCFCSCDYDLEPCEVWGESRPRARRRYVCCECGEAIEPGTRYQKVTTLSGGYWDVWKTCSVCERIRDDLCFCAPMGCLDLELRETYGVGLTTEPDDIEDET